jgi:hypothetical protein
MSRSHEILGPYHVAISIPVLVNANVASYSDRGSFVTASNRFTKRMTLIFIIKLNNNDNKIRDFSPRANYTDRATAACW